MTSSLQTRPRHFTIKGDKPYSDKNCCCPVQVMLRELDNSGVVIDMYGRSDPTGGERFNCSWFGSRKDAVKHVAGAVHYSHSERNVFDKDSGILTAPDYDFKDEVVATIGDGLVAFMFFKSGQNPDLEWSMYLIDPLAPKTRFGQGDADRNYVLLEALDGSNKTQIIRVGHVVGPAQLSNTECAKIQPGTRYRVKSKYTPSGGKIEVDVDFDLGETTNDEARPSPAASSDLVCPPAPRMSRRRLRNWNFFSPQRERRSQARRITYDSDAAVSSSPDRPRLPVSAHTVIDMVSDDDDDDNNN